MFEVKEVTVKGALGNGYQRNAYGRKAICVICSSAFAEQTQRVLS